MESKRLTGKVAVVTGASKGIGAGIAKQLAAEGAAVVVNYASSKEGADQVVNEITARGGKAIAVQGDVAKTEDIEQLFAEANKAFGRLDILILSNFFERREPINARIVDENIEPAECFACFGKQMLDVSRFRHITLNRDRLPSARGNLIHHLIRAFL